MNELERLVMPEYKSLEHGSTVVVCENSFELFFVLRWAGFVGKGVSEWMHERDTFPFCVAVAGDLLSWTDRMDRALYYKPFTEFRSDIAE